MGINGRFIPEFERHYGTIAIYPFRTDIWRADAHFMQEYLINLVKCISKYEKVFLVCRLEDVDTLEKISFQNVNIVPFEYDDIWARDIGPTFIVENEKTNFEVFLKDLKQTGFVPMKTFKINKDRESFEVIYQIEGNDFKHEFKVEWRIL